MSRKSGYTIDMCNGAILPKLLQFSLPLMLSSVLQLLFNAADIIVVGRFAGDNSLAAVGSTAQLIGLLVNFFIGLSVGVNILAARYYGANDQKKLHQVVHTAMPLSLICGLGLAVIGTCFAQKLLVLMQSPDAVINLASLYLRIYFLGTPANLIYNFGAAILRAAGDTRRPLFYLTLSGVLNVSLNLLLVIVFHMDVAGVAIATIVSQYLSAFLVVRCLIHESDGICLVPEHLHIYPDALKEILRVGLPAGLNSSLFAIANTVVQSSVNTFGEIVVAGNAAACNIEGFIYAAVHAFYQANISFTSQNLGGKKYNRLMPVLFQSLACAIFVGLALSLTVTVFAPQFISIYSDSPAVIAAGITRIKIVTATYTLLAVMDVIVGTIRGLGHSLMPMIVSLVGACGLRLLWIATVFQIEKYHTIQTVYYAYPISWILTIIAHVICLFIAIHQLKQKIALEKIQ